MPDLLFLDVICLYLTCCFSDSHTDLELIEHYINDILSYHSNISLNHIQHNLISTRRLVSRPKHLKKLPYDAVSRQVFVGEGVQQPPAVVVRHLVAFTQRVDDRSKEGSTYSPLAAMADRSVISSDMPVIISFSILKSSSWLSPIVLTRTLKIQII